MAVPKLLVTRSDEVMSGAVVFAGTRVPVQTLLDYLQEGDTLDDCLGGLSDGESRARGRCSGVGQASAEFGFFESVS